MLFRSYKPGPPLAEFVDRFWHCSDAPPHRMERIVPSGTIELVINLLDNEVRIYDPAQRDRCKRYPGAVVSGTYCRFFAIDTAQHASIMGVHFKPGGAFPFLGVPAHPLVNAHLDLESFWGRAAHTLRERVCACATPTARFQILEDVLRDKLQAPPQRHAAVLTALDIFTQRNPGASIGDVAQRIGMSRRRFIQVFKAEVGLTPKLFCRIQRFQPARAALQSGRPQNWAQVALLCGYFDQSHMIHEFKEFSGLSPTDYAGQSLECVMLNHLPVME